MLKALLTRPRNNSPLRKNLPSSAPISRHSISQIPENVLSLQRKASCACGGGCPDCQSKQLIQTKLSISQPGDMYEQEADRVADQVMRMPEQPVQRACAQCAEGGAPCPKCENEQKVHVQRKAGVGTEAESVPDNFVGPLGSGRPLDMASRAFFEPRFGQDFGQVRLHTGSRAAESARGVNALAYTVGQDVVFGAGQYKPETAAGQRLLAHELTHVVQQGAARGQGHATRPAHEMVQRAAPVAAAAPAIGAIVAKCIIGAITGVLFDAAIQAALHSWRQRTWRFWQVTLNWCSIIFSAMIGCIAGPISAYLLEPWIAAQLGTRLGGIVGTLIGKVLLFIANKLGMAIPKSLVGTLLKLNCVSPEQAAELGVPVESIE